MEKINVQALVGMETWEETALVADIGNQAQVPIVSFASVVIPPLMPRQWPFLVQMASNVKEQIRCTTAIVRSFDWQKVIAIFEADYYGSDSGMFVVLSDSLQDVGVAIEYRLVLPPFSSLDDPESFVTEAVAEQLSKESRVFIVLQLSLSMSVRLFRESKQMGLNGRDSAWIIIDPVASFLDSVNTSVISSMAGALGIKTYFTEDSRSFLHFKHQFRRIFQSEYPDEDTSEMGIYALRAYDSITATTNAIKRTERLVIEESGPENRSDNKEILSGLVNWPGDLKRVPKGWAMPTDAKPMKIGVPGIPFFQTFVKVDWNGGSNELSFPGFCIDVFYEVLNILERSYPLPNEFIPYNGT
ncbi:unnamed protein product [Ilex paraguariensis]|uniref:Receptor ligand binding region domain-containing protein n=1 Tax=Ilex paraguariensis TaxID=185542 RepID=A0ABC8RU09_9AQUA